MDARRPSAGRVGTAAAVTMLMCIAAWVPTAVAATPSVTGSVTGELPSASRAVTVISAIELGGAQVAASERVGSSGAFRLNLPPGAYVLDTSVIPRRGAAGGGMSRFVPVSIAPGQRRRAIVIPKPTAKSAAVGAPRARAAYTQESGAINPGQIAFQLQDFTGATGSLSTANPLVTTMIGGDLSASPPCRSTEVASARDRVMVLKELQLQKSKYFDQSTRVKRNFVIPDILIRGQLHNRGANIGYTITLIDARTHVTLETLSGTLPTATDAFFEAEGRLAKQIAKRICAYGEVFEVTFTGTGTANFPTHSAAGTLSAQAITAKPTAGDSQGPTQWEGSAPMSWTDVTATSKIDCSFSDLLSGGMWTADLERVGTAMQVKWTVDKATSGTATVVCPDGETTTTSIPGQPTTSVLDSAPATFTLPSNATQAITSKADDTGFGWVNTLQMKIRTLRVQLLN